MNFQMDYLNTPPSLDALKKELALYYGAIAVMLEQCYRPTAGMRMLGLNEDEWATNGSDAIDVGATEIGKMLPVWYRYAYEGILSAGYSLSDVNTHDDGPLERLRDMIELLDHDDGYFIECLNAALPRSGGIEPGAGALANLGKHIVARSELDSGRDLALDQLVVLAKMNERSVRNAMVPGGELQANDRGEVPNQIARNWLNGRRGFVPTVFKEAVGASTADVPDVLDMVELPPFVESRLQSLWKSNEIDHDDAAHPFERWVGRAARECGLPAARIWAASHLPFDIRPDEVPALARALRVDPVWLNHQVMSALFPDQVDMLLNPKVWATPHERVQPQTTQAITVTLTEGMLTHGYIDLPVAAKDLFPSISMGSRKEGDTGSEVELIYGSHRALTDIRVKSGKTISPRKRFSAWLNTELGARPGDRIRVEKTGERQYTLTHIAG